MSTLLKIKALSKYGFFVEGEEKGIYFDRSVPESDRGKFVPGAELEVELRTTESGTKYVTKVLNLLKDHMMNPSPLVASVFEKPPMAEQIALVESVTEIMKEKVGARSKAPSKPLSGKLSDYGKTQTDWVAKDRSQLIGGLSHDAAELAAAAVAYNVPISSVVDQYKLALVALIKIREEVR